MQCKLEETREQLQEIVCQSAGRKPSRPTPPSDFYNMAGQLSTL